MLKPLEHYEDMLVKEEILSVEDARGMVKSLFEMFIALMEDAAFGACTNEELFTNLSNAERIFTTIASRNSPLFFRNSFRVLMEYETPDVFGDWMKNKRMKAFRQNFEADDCHSKD